MSQPREVSEKTFSTFSKSQSAAYAAARFDYTPLLYNTILAHHVTTSGAHELIVDIGCGPGQAARGFAPHFRTTIGLDPSPNMIATARELTTQPVATQPTTTSESATKESATAVSAPIQSTIRFDVSAAEELGANLNPPVAEHSVDLLVAANAAHWFDMPRFWEAAKRAVKPGGTVALWTTGEGAIAPDTPNAAKIQAALDRYVTEHLEAYYEPGNWLTKGRYASLKMPWDVGVEGFGDLVRRDWEPTERWVNAPQEAPLDMFEMLMASASPQIRWYEAHPGVKGTEGDVLKKVRREIEDLLREAGVERGKEMIKGCSRGALLMVKRI